MNPNELAIVQKAQIERATDGNFSSIRRATVTAISPFTILMNGVSVVSPPRSPNYGPVVGDVVLVLMDGAAPYVLESMNRPSGPVLSLRNILDLGPSAVTTSVDWAPPAFTAPVTGWAEVDVSAWVYVGSTSIITTMLYDNSTDVSVYQWGGFTGQAVQSTPANQGADTGTFNGIVAGAWHPMKTFSLHYPVSVGVSQQPIIRMSGSASTNMYLTGMMSVKVYST